VSSEGKVSEWHGEEGWGVIEAPDTPGGCWAHYSAILTDGHAELHAGDVVTFTYERVEQDGYHFRAVDVWPPGIDPSTVTRATPVTEPSDAYRSMLLIRLDDGEVIVGDHANEFIRREADNELPS
jgi:CspA family cold shock protein